MASLERPRTEGGGHKPVSLSHFSGEAPGDSGASPWELPCSFLNPRSNGHPAVGPVPPRGMGLPAGGLQLICKLLLRATEESALF